MGTLEVVFLALALGADCFSVCIGLGMERSDDRRLLKLSALLGLVQSFLFVVGYQSAAAIHALLHISGVFEGIIGTWLRAESPAEMHDRVHVLLSIGGALALALVGANMIASSVEKAPGLRFQVRKGRIGLLVVAVMVNVDSITAGLGLGMVGGVRLTEVAILLALVGAGMAWLGLSAGRRIGGLAGRYAQPTGGAILVVIAAKVLLADVW